VIYLVVIVVGLGMAPVDKRVAYNSEPACLLALDAVKESREFNPKTDRPYLATAWCEDAQGRIVQRIRYYQGKP